jgi:DNA-binding transcriptional LysR family regulator
MHYLLKVADLLSFSRAAQALGIPASSVSRRIADLEAALGVELLHRTTRTVRLTEVGRLYVEQIRAAVDLLKDADEAVTQRDDAPRGTLRISVMQGYGQSRVMPVLREFQALHPDLVLDVHLSDAVVDLGRDQVDLAIRGGRQPQDRVVARKLDPNRFVLAASPAYLKRHGRPASLEDLVAHPALMYRGPNAIIKWQGRDADGWRELPMSPAFVTNDGATLIGLASEHRGLVLLPEWSLEAAFRERRLTRVEMAADVSVSREGESGIYLLYLQPRFRIPKIKVAVDFLVERLGGARA